MESILSLLLIGAIYSVVYVVKSLRTPADKSGAPVFGEAFPTIEVLEPERTDAPAPQPAKAEYRPVTAMPRKKSDGMPLHAVAPAIAEEKPEKRERLVRIGNKSEAKRAFLYSEIFNRKY